VTSYAYYGDGGPGPSSFRLWQIRTSYGANTLFDLRYGYR
jgi:hypothetical protein